MTIRARVFWRRLLTAPGHRRSADTKIFYNFGSLLTATFTVPPAAAVTRRVLASKAMPVRVVDPHQGRVVGVEDAEGRPLGAATPLDVVANVQRKRRKPGTGSENPPAATTTLNAVELAYRRYHGLPLDEPQEDTP